MNLVQGPIIADAANVYYARMDDYVSAFTVTLEAIIVIEPAGTEFAPGSNKRTRTLMENYRDWSFTTSRTHDVAGAYRSALKES